MDLKLKLDKEVAELAHKYSQSKGMTLAEVVEQYITELVENNFPKEPKTKEEKIVLAIQQHMRELSHHYTGELPEPSDYMIDTNHWAWVMVYVAFKDHAEMVKVRTSDFLINFEKNAQLIIENLGDKDRRVALRMKLVHQMPALRMVNQIERVTYHKVQEVFKAKFGVERIKVKGVEKLDELEVKISFSLAQRATGKEPPFQAIEQAYRAELVALGIPKDVAKNILVSF